MSIKKNLDNNLSASIVYRAINNKPCFTYLLNKQYQWHTFALTHVDWCPCRCMSAMAQEPANNHLKALFHLPKLSLIIMTTI